MLGIKIIDQIKYKLQKSALLKDFLLENILIFLKLIINILVNNEIKPTIYKLFPFFA